MVIRSWFRTRAGRRLAAILLGAALCAGCSSSPPAPTPVDPVQEALKAGKESYAKAFADGKMVSGTNLDQALRQFTKALSYNLRCAEAYHERGKVFAALGLYELAGEDDSRAVQIQPCYPEAYLARAEALFQLQLFSRAIDDAKMAIRQDPQQGSAYTLLGKAYFYSQSPDYLEAKNSLAVAQRLDKHFDAADLILQAEEKLHPPPAPEKQIPSSAAEPKQPGGNP
jgi:tetratricopeptide (TPR) repeat protein